MHFHYAQKEPLISTHDCVWVDIVCEWHAQDSRTGHFEKPTHARVEPTPAHVH